MIESIKQLASNGILICPQCNSQLAVNGALHCTECVNIFPFLGDIPVVFDRPDEYIAHWWQQYLNYVQVQEQCIAYEKKIINMPSTYPPFKKRLATSIQARAGNMAVVGNMMTPLQGLVQESGVSTQAATKSTFDFTNLLYLIRDWGWDTGESEIMCEKVIDILPDQLSVESMLVIGAGGCKESYILHEHYKSPLTVSVDIDPFKLTGAATVISGGELNLYQILSTNVRDESCHVSYWRLKSPKRPENLFLYLLADARSLPFGGNTFQVIFTPFLIDAVGEDFRKLSDKIKHILKPGGYWINYGAMNFRPEVAYTGNEILSILCDTGFQVISDGYSRKPHIAPGESCLHQIYDCLYFLAKKKKDS